MKIFQLVPRGHRAWFFLILGWTIFALFIISGAAYILKMPNRSYSGPFQALSTDEKLVHDHLKEHISILAESIGERNLWRFNNLKASALYIEKVFKDLGYNVQTQPLQVEGLTVKNLEVELMGSVSPGKIVVVGAHYDSVMGSPGANDNASGVAGLLEITRLIKNTNSPVTVRLVAFVNEEPPFFQTKNMGSHAYALRSHQRGEQIVGMVSLETIGYYSDDAGSQNYPFPFHFFYPHTANFIGFVGNLSSRSLLRRVLSTFRKNTAFPSEGVAAPGWITGLGWSDHWAFWKYGYPAIMITDTALYRYGFYHTPEDTIEKIDYRRMARVVTGIARVVTELANTK